MSELVSVRVENGQKDALDEMIEHGDADTQAEAVRRALNVGLADLGYINGSKAKRNAHLRATTRRFADAFGLLGVLLLGATFWLPIEFRMYVVAPFAAALACLAVDRAIEVYDPDLSTGVLRIFRSGEKA